MESGESGKESLKRWESYQNFVAHFCNLCDNCDMLRLYMNWSSYVVNRVNGPNSGILIPFGSPLVNHHQDVLVSFNKGAFKWAQIKGQALNKAPIIRASINKSADKKRVVKRAHVNKGDYHRP